MGDHTTESDDSSTSCRICLEEDVLSSLCTPCACKGSQQYVHRSCLRLWQARQVRSNAGENFCSTCQQKYDFNCVDALQRVWIWYEMNSALLHPICAGIVLDLGYFAYYQQLSYAHAKQCMLWATFIFILLYCTSHMLPLLLTLQTAVLLVLCMGLVKCCRFLLVWCRQILVLVPVPCVGSIVDFADTIVAWAHTIILEVKTQNDQELDHFGWHLGLHVPNNEHRHEH
jgi:hypothetical protein